MAMLYRTDDPGKWGTGKGANLTPGEVDNNFWEIIQRLVSLETDPPEAASISNIEVIGTQMMIYLSDGTQYGPYTLPVASFRFRGKWIAGNTYTVLDLVTVKQSGLYRVNINHTADATFDPARTIGGNPVYTLVFGELAYVYNFGLFYPMRPGQGIASDSYMAARLFEYGVILSAGLPGSLAKLRVPPALDLSFPIRDQDDTDLGSIDFTAGNPVGTFTFDADWTGEIGDYVYVAPPDVIDDAARDLMVTIVGTRVM